MDDFLGKTILKEREFKAELPSDFKFLISIKKDSLNLRFIRLEETSPHFSSPSYKHGDYRIQEGTIYFLGGFSRWWMIRVIQKGWNNLFPAQYELKYVKSRVPGVRIYQHPLTEKECFKKA